MENIKNTLILFFLIISPVLAQYKIAGSTFGNGGGKIANSSNATANTLGQTLIGKTANISYSSNTGFWYQSASILTSLQNPFDNLPKAFELYQNYPNPFNPLTHIKFALPKTAQVRIDVYNLLGQRVVTLLDDKKPAGYFIVDFDANKFASGLYFYTISAEHFYKVKKMTLLK